MLHICPERMFSKILSRTDVQCHTRAPCPGRPSQHAERASPPTAGSSERRRQPLSGHAAVHGGAAVLRGRRHSGRGRRATGHQPSNRQPAAVGGQAAGHRAHRGGSARRGAPRRSGRPAGAGAQPGVGLPQPRRCRRPAPGRTIVDVMGRRPGTRRRPCAQRSRPAAGRRPAGVVGPHGLRGRPVRPDAAARRRRGPHGRRQRSARGVVPDQRDHPLGGQPGRRARELPFRAGTARRPSCTVAAQRPQYPTGACISGRMRAAR